MKETSFKWTEVTEFNFTYAITGGAWLRDSIGNTEWFSFDQITKQFSTAWIDRQLRKQGMFTGCWVKADKDVS